MCRWRKQYYPKTPKNLEELSELLRMEQWKHLTTYEGGRLCVVTLQVENLSSVCIIFDPEFLGLLHHIKELYIDATFKDCPRQPKVHQLLTIMARVNDAVILITWVLMLNKNLPSYCVVLHYFSTIVAPAIRPTTISMDFEIALYSAVEIYYPQATICFCYFHHVQALMKKIINMGGDVIRRFHQWDEAKVFLRKLISLALLPACDIRRRYNWLINNATAHIRESFQDLLNYYSQWWIIRRTPQKFSVYLMPHRTNNNVEVYHRILLQRMGIHPSIWQFINNLRSLQSVTRTELQSLRMGQSVERTALKQTIERNCIVDRAWELYALQIVDILKFLSCASLFTPAFNNNLIIRSAEEVDFFIDAKNHDIRKHLNPPIDVAYEIISGVISIFQPQPYNGNTFIFLLRNLEQCTCPLCNSHIVNIVCIPCWHWFLCDKCTFHLINLASAGNDQILCRICQQISVAFQ